MGLQRHKHASNRVPRSFAVCVYICLLNGVLYICLLNGVLYICLLNGVLYICLLNGVLYICLLNGSLVHEYRQFWKNFASIYVGHASEVHFVSVHSSIHGSVNIYPSIHLKIQVHFSQTITVFIFLQVKCTYTQGLFMTLTFGIKICPGRQITTLHRAIFFMLHSQSN